MKPRKKKNKKNKRINEADGDPCFPSSFYFYSFKRKDKNYNKKFNLYTTRNL